MGKTRWSFILWIFDNAVSQFLFIFRYAFICFDNAEKAKAAAETMKDKKIAGKYPIIQFAKVKEPRLPTKRPAPTEGKVDHFLT